MNLSSDLITFDIPNNTSGDQPFFDYSQFTVKYVGEVLQVYSNTLLTKQYKRVLLSLYILILLLGTFVNVLLVYTIRHLRNPKSLANRRMLIFRVICDLALVWIGVPFTAYTAVYRNWQLGSAMCKLSAFTIYFIVALNNFLLVAICLNRTMAISQNDKGPTDPNTNVPFRVKCLLCAAVLLALIIAFPGGVVIQEVKYPLPKAVTQMIDLHPELRDCHPRMCKDTWSRRAQLAYDIILFVTIYLLPLFVVCLSQHVVTEHLKQSQQLLVLMGHQNTVAWTRRRQRLTRLCVLMAALFVLSWSPNHIANLLVKAFHVNHESTEILLDFSMLIALSNGVTGPFLLIATCSVYNRYFRRLFSCSLLRLHVSTRTAQTTTTPRSSITSHYQVVHLRSFMRKAGGSSPRLEVAPRVIHSVASDFDNEQFE